jgi:hypothetical protein
MVISTDVIAPHSGAPLVRVAAPMYLPSNAVVVGPGAWGAAGSVVVGTEQAGITARMHAGIVKTALDRPNMLLPLLTSPG